jgi:hypothetical protein
MPEIFRVVATAVGTTNTLNVLNFGPTSSAIVRLLTVCNTHTSQTASISIQVAKQANTNVSYVMFAYTQVSAQQTVTPLSEPLTLEAGDVLQVKSDSSASFHVVASALQIT